MITITIGNNISITSEVQQDIDKLKFQAILHLYKGAISTYVHDHRNVLFSMTNLRGGLKVVFFRYGIGFLADNKNWLVADFFLFSDHLLKTFYPHKVVFLKTSNSGFCKHL